jgi:hypothetical protein
MRRPHRWTLFSAGTTHESCSSYFEILRKLRMTGGKLIVPDHNRTVFISPALPSTT